MGLLSALSHAWGAAAEDASRLETMIEARDDLWREIGRLSLGHRSHLSDDPIYTRLLADKGKAICQEGVGEMDPFIEDLAARARSLDEQIRSLISGQVPAAPAH